MVDITARPVCLIPVEDAVSELAVALADPKQSRCQALLSNPSQLFRSQHLEIPAPVILMRQNYVELERGCTRRVTRRVLFARDHYTCQYCGFQATPGRAMSELTIDHVKPAHLFPNRLAATTWENCVAACSPCNSLKGGRLPMECGMMPKNDPREPHYVQLRFAGHLNAQQRDYVADFYGLTGGDEIVL